MSTVVDYKISDFGNLHLPKAQFPQRQGGFEFEFDRVKCLWLVRDYDCTVHLWDMGVSYWGVLKGATPSIPETASPLWDKPETVKEEIIAYRGWHYDTLIDETGSVKVCLESLHQEFYWEGPVVTADQPPSVGEQNGLYALRLDPHHKENFQSHLEGAPIWGRVALTGLVVEGTTGYRAERAAIQELWVNPKEDFGGDSMVGLCKALGDRYQCDASIRTPSWEELTALA